jgi:hypothetical protein
MDWEQEEVGLKKRERMPMLQRKAKRLAYGGAVAFAKSVWSVLVIYKNGWCAYLAIRVRRAL